MWPGRVMLAVAILSFGAASQARAQEVRAFWADAFNEAIKSPQQIDTLLSRLHRANCNAVFAQVRKGGDAYYRSRYDPWASDNPERFDALAELIRRAHAMNPPIQVHAWINKCAVGGGRGNAKHIVVSHPEYLSLSDKGADHDGEATKVDPGHPDAADWTFRVYLDVARHYDVDGIHFDFVRYGGPNWGYNPVSVSRFNARHGRTDSPRPDDPLWMQWRRDQVTALVRKVYLMAAAVRPRVAVSAATITWGKGPSDRATWAQKTPAMTRVFQDWRAWMQEGILDLNCLMSYYSEQKYPEWFRLWIDWAKDNQYRRWCAPSSGIWLNTISDSLQQVAAIRKPSRHGARPRGGVLLYSYAGTNAKTGGGEEQYNEDLYTALAQPTNHGSPPFASPSRFPAMPWKARPTKGHIKGYILGADSLLPVDGALVTLSGRTHRRARTDATGFYGFVDLSPGRYVVTARNSVLFGQVRGGVTRGGVTTLNMFVGHSAVPVLETSGDVAALPEGYPLAIRDAVVIGGSDTFHDRIVVQSGSGSPVLVNMAVRPVLALQPGDRVAVRGRRGQWEGEPCVADALVRLVGMDSPDTPPIAIGDSGAQVRNVTARRIGPYEWAISGRVTEVLPDRFRLDAGADVEVLTAGLKEPDVEASLAPLSAPALGSNVTVRGVLTARTAGGNRPACRLRPRAQSDISVELGGRSVAPLVAMVVVVSCSAIAWRGSLRRQQKGDSR